MHFDEYLLYLISKCEPKYINYLEKSGIDFNLPEYVENETFRRLSSKFFLFGIGLTCSWIAEKQAVSPELLEEIYGPYFMGTSVCADERCDSSEKSHNDPYTRKAFLDYITNPPKQEFYTKLLDNLYNDPNSPYSSKDFECYFFRQSGDKKGIKFKLKDWGFDVDSFSDKMSEFKIYFLIFLTEHNPAIIKKHSIGDKSKNHINVFKFLNNPTSENADRSELGIESANKDIIQFLKSETLKGISYEYATKALDSFMHIVSLWDALLLDKINLKSSEILHIHELWNLLWNNKDTTLLGKNRDGMLETFYLKLLEHERLGIERDLMLSFETGEGLEALKINPQILDYIKKSNDQINVDKIEEFLQTKRNIYARIIFQSDKVTSNQYQKYDTACDAVIGFAKIQNSNCIAISDTIDELKLLIAFDEYIKLSKKVHPDNKFYSHTTNEPKKLKADIPYGDQAFSINQFTWFEHINQAYLHYSHKDSNDLKLIKKDISMVLQWVYTANSVTDMIKFNTAIYYLFRSVSCIYLLPEYYNEYNSHLNGYFLEQCPLTDIFVLIFNSVNYSSYSPIEKVIAENILKLIPQIKDKEIGSYKYEFQTQSTIANIVTKIFFNISYEVNYIKKSIKITEINWQPK